MCENLRENSTGLVWWDDFVLICSLLASTDFAAVLGLTVINSLHV
jgi:hypothetical protein